MRIVGALIACTLISCLGCAQPQESSEYCLALSSSVATRNVPVKGLHVYGTLEHGSVALDGHCIAPAFKFSSMQARTVPAAVAGERIREFNQAVYGRPAKMSGMFAFDGTVNVLPDSRLVELVRIDSFHEVDEIERKRILDLLHRSDGR